MTMRIILCQIVTFLLWGQVSFAVDDAYSSSESLNVNTKNASTQYAYVADSGRPINMGAVWKCPLNSNGSFGTCTVLHPAETKNDYKRERWYGPFKISFTSVMGSEYAYIANGSGSIPPNIVYTCLLNNNGTFNTCNSSGPFVGASQVAFATVDGTQYAYVADYGSPGAVWQCQISVFDGALFGCMSQDIVTWGHPNGVTIQTINNTQYAYISDFNSGQSAIYQCTIDSTNGSFSSCGNIPAPRHSWAPWEVAFQSIGGTQYAYIADSTDPGPYNAGFIWQCMVNPTDGSLHQCSQLSPQFASLTSPYKEPFGVAFATVNGTQYAYVSDGGTSRGTYQVYKCTLNSNGMFNTCSVASSKINKWQASGVSFLPQ